tara:strand:+ start:234 stop:578 length:345 start_codon:yes stop_codon:yes gene_type:complete
MSKEKNNLEIPDFNWEFIEKWYTDYDHCAFITANDDLSKIIHDEIQYGDYSHRLALEIGKEKNIDISVLEGKTGDAFHNETIPEAIKLEAYSRFMDSNLMLYKEAIKNYLNHKK